MSRVPYVRGLNICSIFEAPFLSQISFNHWLVLTHMLLNEWPREFQLFRAINKCIFVCFQKNRFDTFCNNNAKNRGLLCIPSNTDYDHYLVNGSVGGCCNLNVPLNYMNTPGVSSAYSLTENDPKLWYYANKLPIWTICKH